MKVEINPKDQPHLFEPIPLDKLDLLTKEELVILLRGERDISRQMAAHVHDSVLQTLALIQKSAGDSIDATSLRCRFERSLLEVGRDRLSHRRLRAGGLGVGS